MPFRTFRTQRVDAMNARNGSASMMADRSGWLIAQDFGAISPTTMWRNTTTATARTVAMTEAIASGSGVSWSSGSSRSATAGLASAPRPSVARVIPSWAPARPRDSSRLLRTAARADRPPKAAATSRRCRLAETTANSAATKNALATSSRTDNPIETTALMRLVPRRRRRTGAAAA